ncbi:hypothetical protein SNE40_006023 [Patella caerulea]|uniref:DUF7869 domain-containing protein n=2 Tax=Patella caerulea TaxID=87958 RepID=A0AAN8K0M2_PATCE
MASSKGSNSVINYLHHFFDNYGLGEKEAELHCDNCSGQNKNRFILWYMAWRTMHKLHSRIGLHFLIVGHTKFAPDWCFGLIKQKYRRTRVGKLEDIAAVVRESTVTGVNIPQLVWLEDGTVYVKAYDWQTFLQPYFRPLQGIKNYQHFSFDSSTPGLVIARDCSDSENVTRFQLLKDPENLPPVNLPPVIQPPGLDQKRQTYLYDQIRDFCDDESKDISCPKPCVETQDRRCRGGRAKGCS